MDQISANKVKKGSYIMIEEEPCEVKDADISSPGKHGSAKIKIRAEGIFDGQTRNVIKNSGQAFLVPDIKKKAGQVLSLNDSLAQVMDLQDYNTFEIDVSGHEVTAGEEIQYWDVNGKKTLELG